MREEVVFEHFPKAAVSGKGCFTEVERNFIHLRNRHFPYRRTTTSFRDNWSSDQLPQQLLQMLPASKVGVQNSCLISAQAVM